MLLVTVLLPGLHHPLPADSPTFYKDVLPILEQHCQVCHRSGEIAPMPLVTFEQSRAYAKKMKEMTGAKMMPPWFADPRFGHFSNDNSLMPQQIATIQSGADHGVAAGNASDAPHTGLAVGIFPRRKW